MESAAKVGWSRPTTADVKKRGTNAKHTGKHMKGLLEGRKASSKLGKKLGGLTTSFTPLLPDWTKEPERAARKSQDETWKELAQTGSAEKRLA